METVTVYRVEHPKTKRGPWHSPFCKEYDKLPRDEKVVMGKAQRAVIKKYSGGTSDKTRPGAHIDCGPEGAFALDTRWVCGCLSLKDLRDWFASIGDELAEAGFTVMAYEVPQEDVIHSKSRTQVLMLPSAVMDEKDLTILALVE